jgi:hypothetical protein
MRSRRVLVALAAVAVALGLVTADGGEAAPPKSGPEAAGVPPRRIAPVGDAVDLSRAPATRRLSPSVAYNSVDHEYMVVWFDARNAGNNDIFGQRVTVTGLPMGPNFPLIQIGAAQVDPVVAYNSADNQYLVVWRTQQAGFFNQARGRRIASDGTHLGGDFFINRGGLELSAAYNPAANEWLVTGRVFPGSGIRGRRVKSDGSLASSEFVISSTGVPNGQVAYNANANEYLATWGYYSGAGLEGQRISGRGAPLGIPMVISPVYPGSESAASVAFDAANDRHLVVLNEAGASKILGRFVSGSGGLVDDTFAIATGLAGPANPSIAHSPSDDVFVIVSHEGDDIVARLLSAGGVLMGPPLLIADGTASGEPSIAYNSRTGQFLVAWPDDRNVSLGEEDIFARLLNIVSVGPGDANCDGSVDAVDAALILQYAAGLIGSEPCLAAAGVNSDGSLNAVDAALILQHVAGLIPGLPVP